MKLTPLDVKNQQFTTRWRGYDSIQVHQFLEMITGDLEETATENNALRDEVKSLRAELDGHIQREQTLKDTMVTAQRLADEIRESAEKKAQLLIGEAEKPYRRGLPKVEPSAVSQKSLGIRPSLHPGSLRCSSVKYSRYSPSSRLASRAPRRPRCSRHF